MITFIKLTKILSSPTGLSLPDRRVAVQLELIKEIEESRDGTCKLTFKGG